MGHRGWKGDPLYGIRKLLLMGAERIDDKGWERLHTRLRAGDCDGVVTDCWAAKEKVRDIYLTADAADPDQAQQCLDIAIEWCDSEPDIPELATLAKTLRRWSTEIIARHRTGATNGPVEAAIIWSPVRGVFHVADESCWAGGVRVTWSDVFQVRGRSGSGC